MTPEGEDSESKSTSSSPASSDVERKDDLSASGADTRSTSTSCDSSPAERAEPVDADLRAADPQSAADGSPPAGTGNRISRFFTHRLAKWFKSRKVRWSTGVVTFLLGVLAVVADWQGASPVLPCFLRGEEKLSEPYGIAVANVAIQRENGQSWSSQEEENAEDVNKSLIDQVRNAYKDDAGKIGVGSPCDRDVQPADGREAYLAEVLDDLGGELAVSVTLKPEGRQTVVRIDLLIGPSTRWNEAHELAQYYPFDAGVLGDSIEIRDTTTNSGVTELVNPYITMLRAIANYTTKQYLSAIRSLDEILALPSTSPDLTKLAYVLKGNAEGRLSSPGALERAEAAFIGAQSIDGNYARARLGLAEIDYQRGLTRIENNNRTKCESRLSPQARELMDSAIQKYETIYQETRGSDVPDIDARARYGSGRIHACLLLLGDSGHAMNALRDLKYVTDRFESGEGHTWLQSAASGAYGELGLVYCKLHRRNDAQTNYSKASELAVDGDRIAKYREALKLINGDTNSCS